MSTLTALTVPQASIDDLHRRLDQVRWPRRAPGAAVPGFDTERLRPLVEHWRHGFDWRAVEARLDGLGQLLVTTAEGRRLHTAHARGGQRLPVLLIHGWPDSPLRFLDLVPRLTAAGHDVVAPAIPGFGLSEEPDGKISRELVAEDFHTLMTRLGYDRYAVHGGDWGSAIATTLAGLHPDAVAAVHLTDVPFDLAFTIDEATASDAEVAYLRSLEQGAGGQLYLTANTAQPDVTALALTDSPVGLLAWLAHLYDQWSEDQIGADDLLAAASLMWLTGTVRSSMRLYSEPVAAWDTASWDGVFGESASGDSASKDDGSWQEGSGTVADPSDDEAADATGDKAVDPWAPARVEIPTAFPLFPKDLSMAPRALAERHFRVERFTVMPRGGHFAALEQPALVAEDLVAFLDDRS